MTMERLTTWLKPGVNESYSETIHFELRLWLKNTKNNACKVSGARLRFALFLGKNPKFVAYLPRV
jgi:hypothetical protein